MKKNFRTGLPTFAKLKVGDRVRVTVSGVTGVLVKKGYKNVGWLVRWDEPKFGATQGWVRAVNLEKEDEG